jgi:superfamily II DNA/RNA helicase
MAAAFEEFGVMPELIKAVEELGWTLPTDIQAEAIPLILGGGDVMAVRAHALPLRPLPNAWPVP